MVFVSGTPRSGASSAGRRSWNPELHEYLTDAADWDAPTWDFEPEGQQRLARTLSWLYDRVPEAFRFSATWGPVSIDERDVDRDELLAIVENNAVSTGAVYKGPRGVAARLPLLAQRSCLRESHRGR